MSKDSTRNLIMDGLVSSGILQEETETTQNTQKFSPKMRDDLIAVFNKYHVDINDPHINMIISQFFDNLSKA